MTDIASSIEHYLKSHVSETAPWSLIVPILGGVLLLIFLFLLFKAFAGKKQPKEAEAKPASKVGDQTPSAQDAAAGDDDSDRLHRGLSKTRGGFVAKLGKLFGQKPELDESLLEQVEEVLFTADIGVKTSQTLIDAIRSALSKNELKTADDVWPLLKRKSLEILKTTEQATKNPTTKQATHVLLVVGVNGSGKTTTIGKLAAKFRSEGKSVILAAGDTFRAAAADQLEVWGKRSDTPVVRGPEQSDPSAVIVDALIRAKDESTDIVLADTAGRLHTKTGLMDELGKVNRSISKRIPGAPHETLIVLDATMGQNAIAQAKMFGEVTPLTGVVLTKLDGTAKGGVVLGVAHELNLPVKFIGIGEGIDDLRPFSAGAFIDALFDAPKSTH